MQQKTFIFDLDQIETKNLEIAFQKIDGYMWDVADKNVKERLLSLITSVNRVKYELYLARHNKDGSNSVKIETKYEDNFEQLQKLLIARINDESVNPSQETYKAMLRDLSALDKQLVRRVDSLVIASDDKPTNQPILDGDLNALYSQVRKPVKSATGIDLNPLSSPQITEKIAQEPSLVKFSPKNNQLTIQPKIAKKSGNPITFQQFDRSRINPTEIANAIEDITRNLDQRMWAKIFSRSVLKNLNQMRDQARKMNGIFKNIESGTINIPQDIVRKYDQAYINLRRFIVKTMRTSTSKKHHKLLSRPGGPIDQILGYFDQLAVLNPPKRSPIVTSPNNLDLENKTKFSPLSESTHRENKKYFSNKAFEKPPTPTTMFKEEMQKIKHKTTTKGNSLDGSTPSSGSKKS